MYKWSSALFELLFIVFILFKFGFKIVSSIYLTKDVK